ncbi:MAG: 3-hydroxyisobutyrate dehydrogenase [Rhodobacterales bacterium]|nr:3-hydroxyisobutyrate dehydrogenase [Rhodobacterales bacterium]
MSDIHIRIEGVAGRITLTRESALNALTYEMCLAIEDALDDWSKNADIRLLILDAVGDKAFCAGGDIAELYASGKRGDYAYGQQFWRDEYRMNAKLFEFPKPVVSFMQGFTMGGGVGFGCHASHRILCDTSQISMPEVGIGLVPDVGGSLVLAQSPGRLGEYLATTGARMSAGDAILAGFADYFIPQDRWPTLSRGLAETGDLALIEAQHETPPSGPIGAQRAEIDRHFDGETLIDIANSLRADPGEFAVKTLKTLSRNAPLSMACAVEIIHRTRGHSDIRRALALEYRFTHRAMEHGDFIEGIRAAIIDKTRDPVWKHTIDTLPAVAVSNMLLPLGKDALTFEKKDKIMQIGFIGLGNMGGPMAANLAAAGHAVTGFDTAGVTIAGVTNAASAATAATGRDVVITMLPNGAILRAVAADILPAMTKGATHIDCSTVDVDSARAVAQDADSMGVLCVDAPVSGGTGGASNGTLTFMAGGSDAAFAKAAPLFDIMGQKAVHCGASGAGQSAKICNNMILGVTMIATCEAFALADKLGLSREKMFDVVSTSSGYSWTMNAYCPAPGVGPQSPADNDYKPGFAAELMLKDLRLSQQAAQSVDADTPMGQNATELYETFVEQEDGTGMDFSAMLPRFEKRSRK